MLTPNSLHPSQWEQHVLNRAEGSWAGPGGSKAVGFHVPSFRYKRVFLSWEEVRRKEGSHGFQGPRARRFGHSAAHEGTAVGGLSPARRPSDVIVLLPIVSL